MVQAGGSIEAILTLNAVPFKEELNSSISAVKNFTKSLDTISKDASRVQSAIGMLESSLSSAVEIIGNFNASIGNLRNFSSFAQAVNRIANALKILSSSEINVVQSTEAVNNMFRAFKDSLNGAEVRVKGLKVSYDQLNASETQMVSRQQQIQQAYANARNSYVSAEQTLRQMGASINSVVTAEERHQQALANQRNSAESTKTALMQLAQTITQLRGNEERVSNSTNKATSSIQRQAIANRTASASTNQLSSATSRLGKAMSSLRMMGSLVGSMLAYNFAHKLLVATGETIHAKSEMEGYFKMLNFGQNDINHFNHALDQTVAQFQRVNKYSLGETISSIGVEFNLTTKEMEKAMKVTSMITSEYLRAGRNANEASLAVKDVLQGQFQRLSRETGVKGEQLKEAGWSGDTTDVLGLMEALEKVGKSRNWDVFAEKANSLNDILTITQNRFGEWSADMVYAVQPAIVGAFNMIMGTAQKLGGVLSGLWTWLNGDGMENNIAKWTLMGTAITGVLSLIVAYRTGAGLLQVAQIGLTRTIASTVLGLNAETVAMYGTRTAIASKIFGLEAEKIATLSTKDAILSKILGLNAEVVAQSSLKQGILDKAFAQELETMRLSGATKEELLNTLALYENQLAQKSTIGLLSAQALGLNMTTYATHGFTVALIEANTGMKASTIASMGLAKKIALLGVSFVAPLAIVSAFAIALGVLALKMNESAKQMEKFNDLVKNGANIIKENKESVEMYTDRQSKLKEQLAQTEEGTQKYHEIQEQLRVTNQDLITSNENLANSIKAVELATSSQKHFEEAKTDMSIRNQGRLAQAYMRAGYTMKESYEMANESLTDAEHGAEQLRITLQKLAKLDEKSEQNANYLLAEFEENGVDKDVGKKYLKESASLHEKMKHSMEKGMTDESFMGRLDGWLGYYQYQIENWVNNVGAMLETNDWGAIWNNVWKGIAHGFADLPYLKDFWGWAYQQMGLDKYKGKGWNGLIESIQDGVGRLFNTDNDLFTQYANNFINSVTQAFDGVKQTLTAWWNNFWSFDWLLGGVSASDGSSDHPSFMEDISSILGFDIQTWVDSFMADPMGTLGIDLSGLDIFGSLLNFLFGTGDNTDFSWAMEYITNNIITPLSETWNMFMADPLSYLGGAIAGLGSIGSLLTMLLPSDGGVGIWEWANTNLIQPLGNALYQGIISIPLVSDILALFGLVNGENSGSGQKGRDLGESFKTAIEDKIRNIPILGDVLQILGLIPQANPTASSNGQSVGSSIKTGFGNGLNGMADIIRNEIGHIIDAIGQRIEEARNKANELGNAIVSGVRNAIDPGSPGIIARAIIGNEFGTYIPQVITDNGDLAYSSAQYYGEQIKSGISSVNTDSLSMDTAVANYETDAQNIAMSSQMMGTTTSTAFNDMSLAVNNTTAMMSSNVGTTYSQMQQKQTSSLQSMKTQNQTAYQEMYLKSHQSLVQMRDSTSNITSQMISAWTHMKTQLVATANQLRSESTSHFNTLSNTIGDFYRKIQNPSNWGAGGGSSIGVRGARNPSVGRSIASGIRTRGATHHGAGGTASPYMTSSKTMSLRQLKSMICPSGNCDIFDGYDLNERVNVSDFLSQVGGEHGFGWSGWNSRHYNYIKDKSDQWDMKSPRINLAGGIDTNTNFKVGDFENGTPQISFDSFRGMAEAIFTAIPYRFYYDSAWKGSWLGALQAGACNCSDGADALVAFANACGFSGYKQHGTWRNSNGQTFGHFWAVINGHKMDTTGWQNQRNWTPSNSAGSPVVRRANPSYSNNTSEGRTFNLTVNINEPVYGVDDLKEQIVEASREAMREEFNDPYTVTL